MRVVHEDRSVGTMDPYVEALVKLRRKVESPLVLCSTRQLVAFLSPGLGSHMRKAFDFAQQEAPHGLSDRTVSAWESQEPKLRWGMLLHPSCLCWACSHQGQESGTGLSHSHHHGHDPEDGEQHLLLLFK